MDVLVSVVGQQLKIATNFKSLVEGSQNFVRFCFNLDGAWDGLTKVAQFKQGDSAYNVALDDDDRCFLPTEIESGECRVALYGEGTNSVADGYVIATTEAIMVKVGDCVFDEEALDPTDRVTLLELIDALDDRVTALEDGGIGTPITWDMLASAVQDAISNPTNIGTSQLSTQLQQWISSVNTSIGTLSNLPKLTINKSDGTKLAEYNASEAKTVTLPANQNLTISYTDGSASKTYNGSAQQSIAIPSEAWVDTVNDAVSDLDSEIASIDTAISGINSTLSTLSDTVRDEIFRVGVLDAKVDRQIKAVVTDSAATYHVVTYNGGAMGDGIADDGWAIQKLIDDAHENDITSVIYFPAGTYNISRTLFYYSNMTFVFNHDAVVRKMSANMQQGPIASDPPSCIFAPYFDPKVAVYHGLPDSGISGNRYGVENVNFIGGKISGYMYDVHEENGVTVDTTLDSIVLLLCLCRNVNICGMTFDGNLGGHSIEVNSSTNVRVANCVFTGYTAPTSSLYSECLQIDAATCTATASKLLITKGAGAVTPVAGGSSYSIWYKYNRATSGQTEPGYRLTGGYFDFTLLPPGDQYNVNQPEINAKYDKGESDQGLVQEIHGFHQCCHDVEISGCMFICNDGTNCHGSAIGTHTDFGDSTHTGDNYANQEHDKHSDIFVHDNCFYWPGNKGDNSSANYRGVIAFGSTARGGLINSHVMSASVYNNVFHGTGASTDFAITATRGGTRYNKEDTTNFPQSKYRIFGNRYENIVGWDDPVGGGGSMSTLTIKNSGGTTIATYNGSTASEVSVPTAAEVASLDTRMTAAEGNITDIADYVDGDGWVDSNKLDPDVELLIESFGVNTSDTEVNVTYGTSTVGGVVIPATKRTIKNGVVAKAKLATDAYNWIDGKQDSFASISGGTASSSGTNPESTVQRTIKWLALGDSITDLYQRPNNYPYWLTYRNPNITLTNMGIGGALICWDRSNSVNSRQVVNIYHQAMKTEAINSNPDVITIFAGVNDYNWGVPLGTFNQTWDLTGYNPSAVIDSDSGHSGLPANAGTFYQAMSYTIKNIKAQYGTVPIVVFTPMTIGGSKADTTSYYGNTPADFQNAMLEVCGYWGVHCYDLGKHSVITQRDATCKAAYFLDDTHPNAAGSLILSRIIEHEVRKVLHFVGKDF